MSPVHFKCLRNSAAAADVSPCCAFLKAVWPAIWPVFPVPCLFVCLCWFLFLYLLFIRRRVFLFMIFVLFNLCSSFPSPCCHVVVSWFGGFVYFSFICRLCSSSTRLLSNSLLPFYVPLFIWSDWLSFFASLSFFILTRSIPCRPSLSPASDHFRCRPFFLSFHFLSPSVAPSFWPHSSRTRFGADCLFIAPVVLSPWQPSWRPGRQGAIFGAAL